MTWDLQVKPASSSETHLARASLGNQAPWGVGLCGAGRQMGNLGVGQFHASLEVERKQPAFRGQKETGRAGNLHSCLRSSAGSPQEK